MLFVIKYINKNIIEIVQIKIDIKVKYNFLFKDSKKFNLTAQS